MNDPQIDILARGYAEVMNPVDDYSEVSIIYERPIDMDIDYDSAKRFLTWLSQRYCIVEKDKVKEEFETSTHNYEVSGGLRPYRQQYFLGRCAAVKALFPSIAKEIEE